MESLEKQIEYIRTCQDYKIFVIDLFCGAGGETTGIEMAKVNGKKCAKVIAAVNHDKNAIASHAANHHNILHYIEDIRTLNLSGLEAITEAVRKYHPNSILLLHASIECTNFSKAKGGLPRNPDSRTLAEHLIRYIESIRPDYIQIENVVEFMSWGKLDENGKPISLLNGTDYVKWCNLVQSFGYTYTYKILNAADFGAYTNRKRYFGQFAKIGLPHAFPSPTHSKKGDDNNNLFKSLKKYKHVKDVLDLEDDGGEPPYDGKQWLDLSCTEYEIPSDKFKDGDNVEIIIRKKKGE